MTNMLNNYSSKQNVLVLPYLLLLALTIGGSLIYESTYAYLAIIIIVGLLGVYLLLERTHYNYNNANKSIYQTFWVSIVVMLLFFPLSMDYWQGLSESFSIYHVFWHFWLVVASRLIKKPPCWFNTVYTSLLSFPSLPGFFPALRWLTIHFSFEMQTHILSSYCHTLGCCV